ncbi:MAG: XylR family transcriptional regulator [Pirellulales bacterium]|nr:XylR family transcriptional regulator [Pirellulales bacterium]
MAPLRRFTGRNVLLALGWYYPEMHLGVARFARKHNWHLTADFDDPVPKHWRGDGVITLLTARNKLWNQIRKLRVPVVDLTESRPQIQVPRLTMDNAAIGRMAAEYFLNRGYRRLAFFHRWDLGVSRHRGQHFKTAAERGGGVCHLICWQKERGDRPDSRVQRHRWMIQHLRKLPKPLAVLASRDDEAAEVMEACFSIGILVPQQVAILGVDNTETICDCLRVPLSSIDDNREKVGYEGAALLERILSGEKPPQKTIYIPPIGIVERRSTDSLAVEHEGVAAALHFIHQNAHRPISMKDVVKAVAMSRSGLEKAFREHYVRAPMEELRRIRLERVKKMLVETDEKVIVIARSAGFPNPHHLCHIFRKQLGVTPKQYRRLHQEA